MTRIFVDLQEEVDEQAVQKQNPSKFCQTPFTNPIPWKKRKTNTVTGEIEKALMTTDTIDHGVILITQEAGKQHLGAEGEDDVGPIPLSGYIQYVGSKDDIQ